ncbi:hypothetical protein OKW09_002945 [Pseudomonas rhodesiae]|nr:hypothetical protein [Pseudomonas rhodesiae]MDF9770660.1 hypothetical protein [Pseudomonas rhodesiae]
MTDDNHMAVLRSEVKAFIVQALACFDTPSQVVAAVKTEFGIEITRQQCETHDPTKFAGQKLGKTWVDLFHAARKRFREETTDIPIANRAYRLRGLGRLAEKAEIYTDKPGKERGVCYRLLSEFFGVIGSATEVVVDGDAPDIFDAYQAAGIKVSDGKEQEVPETDPLKMKVPELKEWLTAKGIAFDPSAKKEDLQALVPAE